MTCILVAIPYEPARPAIWPKTAERLAARLPRANPGIAFEVALHPAPRTREEGDGKFSANARARNSLLDAWLEIFAQEVVPAFRERHAAEHR